MRIDLLQNDVRVFVEECLSLELDIEVIVRSNGLKLLCEHGCHALLARFAVWWERLAVELPSVWDLTCRPLEGCQYERIVHRLEMRSQVASWDCVGQPSSSWIDRARSMWIG